MSHVDVKKLKPEPFEDEYYDQYEYYNLSDKYAGEAPLQAVCLNVSSVVKRV